MKLWKVSALFGLATASVVAGLFGGSTGCSSTPTADAGASGQPPPPSGPKTTSSKIETFAIKTLFLGEADRSGGPASNTAWKSYGYNLDSLVTSKDSTDVCTLAAGAPKTNQIDGNNGIDNAFGEVILPIIQSAASLPTPSSTISAAIDKGDFTIMLQITGLDDTATQTATGLTGQLFAAAAYDNGTPTFDNSTDWPVSPFILNDGKTIASGSKVSFNSAYIANGTFVSGDLSAGGITVSVSLVFQGVALTLAVNHAVITFDHTAPNVAGNGTIAGVINTQDLITGLKQVAGRISTSLCGSAFDGIAQQITQASDIIHDGTNKSGTPCDGISIGLGFTGALVHDPTKVAVDDGGSSPDPCSASDAGTDTGTKDSASDSSSDATGQ